jgi:hypothetical protein
MARMARDRPPLLSFRLQRPQRRSNHRPRRRAPADKPVGGDAAPSIASPDAQRPFSVSTVQQFAHTSATAECFLLADDARLSHKAANDMQLHPNKLCARSCQKYQLLSRSAHH